ncbi:hypothetical protein E4T56_gene12793 [Termitomyces sp. T112]|nr:hypothetical protein E4T56_gene12793 [Termitomyces sp. T112]
MYRCLKLCLSGQDLTTCFIDIINPGLSIDRPTLLPPRLHITLIVFEAFSSKGQWSELVLLELEAVCE